MVEFKDLEKEIKGFQKGRDYVVSKVAKGQRNYVINSEELKRNLRGFLYQWEGRCEMESKNSGTVYKLEEGNRAGVYRGTFGSPDEFTVLIGSEAKQNYGFNLAPISPIEPVKFSPISSGVDFESDGVAFTFRKDVESGKREFETSFRTTDKEGKVFINREIFNEEQLTPRPENFMEIREITNDELKAIEESVGENNETKDFTQYQLVLPKK